MVSFVCCKITDLFSDYWFFVHVKQTGLLSKQKKT